MLRMVSVDVADCLNVVAVVVGFSVNVVEYDDDIGNRRF